MKNSKLNLVGLMLAAFILISATIDLDNLFNYANQDIPNYIETEFYDNEPMDNVMDDKLATLGRVLFYDKQLSTDNTIACASCHLQEFAFGDTAIVSTGVNGVTGRHSMRLINPRFTLVLGDPFIDAGFFWDERASTLEELSTMPIQDHIEMGYSGLSGDPDFDDLIIKLEALTYYQTLFTFVYGDATITEARIQKGIAQFLRSIQSFDSRYDEGRAMVGSRFDAFPNYTQEENEGKSLFFEDSEWLNGSPVNGRIGGGLACGSFCHQPNSFASESEKRNNGLIFEIDGSEVLDITKAPSLRDIFNPNGELNTPLFHDGSATTINDVFDHYNGEGEMMANSNLGPNGLLPDGQLNITSEERTKVEAFLKTLTGNDVYTNEKWSDPFDENGNIEVIGGMVNSSYFTNKRNILVYPNPVHDFLSLKNLEQKTYSLELYNMNGQLVFLTLIDNNMQVDVSGIANGIYSLKLFDEREIILVQKIIKT